MVVPAIGWMPRSALTLVMLLRRTTFLAFRPTPIPSSPLPFDTLFWTVAPWLSISIPSCPLPATLLPSMVLAVPDRVAEGRDPGASGVDPVRVDRVVPGAAPADPVALDQRAGTRLVGEDALVEAAGDHVVHDLVVVGA